MSRVVRQAKGSVAVALVALCSSCGGESDSVARGDVVGFYPPPSAVSRCGMTAGQVYRLRVVGLPGERVTVGADGRVGIDGDPLDEPYAVGRATAGSYDVPDGAYLLLGDDRARACDSRVFGPVDASALAE